MGNRLLAKNTLQYQRNLFVPGASCSVNCTGAVVSPSPGATSS
jgi:hypothetical protein